MRHRVDKLALETQVGKKYLWEILVPTRLPVYDEAGNVLKHNSVAFRHHKAWDAYVIQLSNGLTVMRPSKGMWVSDDNDLFEERMIPVRIMCTEDDIKKIANFTIKHYRQKAVMYYRITEEVRIVNAETA